MGYAKFYCQGEDRRACPEPADRVRVLISRALFARNSKFCSALLVNKRIESAAEMLDNRIVRIGRLRRVVQFCAVGLLRSMGDLGIVLDAPHRGHSLLSCLPAGPSRMTALRLTLDAAKALLSLSRTWANQGNGRLALFPRAPHQSSLPDRHRHRALRTRLRSTPVP